MLNNLISLFLSTLFFFHLPPRQRDLSVRFERETFFTPEGKIVRENIN